MTRGDAEGLPDIPELEGEYQLVSELGRGGTAVVYLARDRELGRDVAVKLIRPTYVKDEDAVARLIREARTVGKLQHPNIVMLLGTRRLADGGLALILQYVPGRSLKDRIRDEGPLPFDDAEQILRDLASALAYAHRHRIVHRDIKPENVYLDEGVGMARLADFGIARAWDSDSGLTLPGTAIGTPSYMSPEQVDGRELDGRSDLYGLGLLGWEMLTGRQPWEGLGLYAVIAKQKNEDLPPIREQRPDAPERLVRALEGAMRKDPDERWTTADRFLEALGEGSPARSGERSEPLPLSVPWTEASDEGRSGHAVTGPVAGRGGAGVPTGRSGSRLEAAGAAAPADAPSGPAADRPGALRIALVVVTVLLVVLGGLAVAEPEGAVRSALDSVNPWGDPGPGYFDDSEFLRNSQGGSAREEASEGSGAVDPQETPGGGPEADPVPGGTEGITDLDALDVDAMMGEEGAASAGGLAILQGDGQVGTPGAELPTPLIVLLRDEDGNGIGDAELEFDVVAGGGSVDPSLDVTRPDGSSLARWTLGTEGDQRVEVRVAGSDGVEATFEAMLRAAVPAVLGLAGDESVEGLPGQPLDDPVEVRLVDRQGRPVAGETIGFRVVAGDGTVEPANVVTDSQGRAQTTWTLGEAPGGSGTSPQELAAVVLSEPGIGARVEATIRPVTLAIRSGIHAGGSHSCSLGGDGSVVCWGSNDRGQLGDGSTSRRSAPGAPVQGVSFAEIAVGVSHTCGLSAAGEPFCWGANDQGQLGVAGGERTTPVRVPTPTAITRIATGLGHSCGLARNGSIYCWGRNASGELGDGSTSGRAEPGRVASELGFTAVVAGWRHTCALDTQGRAHCWGDGSSGQLGHGGTGSSTTPRAVAGGHRFQHLTAGNAHTCGLATDGSVLCWGANTDGQLGVGQTGGGGVPAPRAIEAEGPFRTVAAGGVHSCALTTDGAALCWGRNIHGQIGDGTTDDRPVPTPVAGNYRFSTLHTFGSHNCGRNPEGRTLCWGYNVEGQLGDGSRQNRAEPTWVQGF